MKDGITEVAKQCFEEAVARFLEKEAVLLELDANERTLCAQLSNHITVLLPEYKLDGYHADIEYNRTKNFDKKIIYALDFKMRKVICDLILHSRGIKEENDNLLALEMKKWTPTEKCRLDCDSDRRRLMALTMPALPDCVGDYSLGIFMRIDKARKVCIFEEYRLGSRVLEWSVPHG